MSRFLSGMPRRLGKQLDRAFAGRGIHRTLDFDQREFNSVILAFANSIKIGNSEYRLAESTAKPTLRSSMHACLTHLGSGEFHYVPCPGFQFATDPRVVPGA